MRTFQFFLMTVSSHLFTKALAFQPQLPKTTTRQNEAIQRHNYYPQTFKSHHNTNSHQYNTARFSFFKDLIDKAFENDNALLSSQDKRKGQLEGPNVYDSSDDSPILVATVLQEKKNQQRNLTPTQEKWRQQQTMVAEATSTQITLANKSFNMDFYLSGIPNKDPSNDLYGSRVNISAREKNLGLLYVPETPTVSDICVEFYNVNDSKKCKCQTSTPFTKAGEEGDWIMSDEGSSNGVRTRQVRFRIPVTGYMRTVETKGSIQSIYWSSEPDKQLQTSTTYSIPAGWLYGEATISIYANGKSVQWQDGVLKVEQATGFLGAGTKMVPCGKFTVKQI